MLSSFQQISSHRYPEECTHIVAPPHVSLVVVAFHAWFNTRHPHHISHVSTPPPPQPGQERRCICSYKEEGWIVLYYAEHECYNFTPNYPLNGGPRSWNSWVKLNWDEPTWGMFSPSHPSPFAFCVFDKSMSKEVQVFPNLICYVLWSSRSPLLTQHTVHRFL